MPVAFVWDLRRKPLGHKVLEFFPRHYLDHLPKCFSGTLPGPVTRPRNKERRNLSAAPWDFLFRQFVLAIGLKLLMVGMGR
jgi:hypothetical protein